tara:strand:+ start:1954 stop:2151 length:198 start_codon:yes stop_codon:yes gene_type:complete
MQLIKHFSFLILYFSASILLSGCGSKGDLYQAETPNSVDEVLTKEAAKNNQNNFQQSTTESKKKP